MINWKYSKRLALLSLSIAVLLLIVTACGGDDDDDPTATTGSGQGTEATEAMTEEATEAMTEEATEEMMDLSGSIDIDGSSTVFPVSQGVAEEFNLVHNGVDITVGFSGTGGGFKKFCDGETQISDASRPIKDEEIEACAENGIEYTEFPIAIDGLSVVVHPDNDWVECLTVDQLTAIWEPDSSVTTWADIDPSWPDEAIEFYAPGTDSGTFDYFTETINGESGATRTENVTFSEDDNVLVVGVEGSENAMGYFGYAYFRENRDRIKVVQVDGGDGCVEPNDETVESNEYHPLSRPLFIYVNNQAIQEESQVAAFVEFYFTDGLVVVPEVGYVLLPQADYDDNLATLESVVNS